MTVPRAMAIPGRTGLHSEVEWRAWFNARLPSGRLGSRGQRLRAKRREKAAERRAVMRGHREACRRRDIPRPLTVTVEPMRPTRDRCHYEKYVEAWAVHADGWCELGTWRAGR